MSSYRLLYFNGRGRAEVSRLIFAAVGQKFEDIRYEPREWSSIKGQMLLGQMPVLEIDGVIIPQSLSIARFLAKQFRLAGRDNLEQAKVDAVVDTILDSLSKFGLLRRETDETKKQQGLSQFFSEDLPKSLKNLDLLGRLYGESGPFFVGKQLTWADLYFYDTAESFLQADGNVLNDYPRLKSNRQEVERQPKISAYIKSRPQTSF